MTRKAKAQVDVKVDKRIDSEELRKQAAALGALLATQAEEARKNAAILAAHGREWATPRVEAAAAWAGPRAEHMWKDAVKATAPKIELAAERVAPAVDTARDKIVEDYLPRISKAMHDAAEAAAKEPGTTKKAATAGRAAKKALAKAPEPQKGGGAAKTIGWIVVGVVAAGAGYLLWRRSQPVDDPWAEEYWDDTTVTSPGATTTDTSSTMGDTTATGPGASDAAQTAADAAPRAAHRAETDEGSSALGDAGEAAKEKGEQAGS